MSEETPTPLVVQAHQYLYYVLALPVIADEQYDAMCNDLGVFGGGGSDCARHYSDEARREARKLFEEAGHVWPEDD